MIDPVSGRSAPVTAAEADLLRPVAIAMIRPLPERGLGFRSIFGFALRGAHRDVATTLVFATVLGRAGPDPPAGHPDGVRADRPGGRPGQVGGTDCRPDRHRHRRRVVRDRPGIALLRARVRVGNALQMALWDRMLRLPASFFRRYQVGDLAERSLVVNAVNEQVTDVVVLALIGGVFGLFNLVAMIVISPQLAVVGLLLCGAGALALFPDPARRVEAVGGDARREPRDLRGNPPVLHRHREDPHLGLGTKGVRPLGSAATRSRMCGR